MINLVKYLKATHSKGIILKPDPRKPLQFYIYAGFCGNWNRFAADEDASTGKSRSGHIRMFANSMISWSSKLQTQIALSTTEGEYIT